MLTTRFGLRITILLHARGLTIRGNSDDKVQIVTIGSASEVRGYYFLSMLYKSYGWYWNLFIQKPWYINLSPNIYLLFISDNQQHYRWGTWMTLEIFNEPIREAAWKRGNGVECDFALFSEFIVSILLDADRGCDRCCGDDEQSFPEEVMSFISISTQNIWSWR